MSGKTIIRTLFPVAFSTWWFASAYFVLFLLHPFLNLFLLRLTKKQYQLFLFVLFLIWVIIPTITTSAFQQNELLEFVVLYSTAGYIRVYGIATKTNSKTCFLIWLLLTFMVLVSCCIMQILGQNLQIFDDHSLYFYGRNKIPTIIRAISFFLVFEKMDLRYIKAINTLASAVFGVYLIHDNYIIRQFLWKEFFINSAYQNSRLIIPLSLLAVITVYVGCSLIDLLRQKTIEALYMKVVSRYSKQIEVRIGHLIEKTRIIIFGKDTL